MKAKVFLLFVYFSHARPCAKTKPKICNTRSCTIAAAHLLKSLDDSVNPCQDFYKFACGRFLKDTHIPHGKTKVDRFTQLEDKVKIRLKKLFEGNNVKGEPKAFENVRAFYKSCINEDKSWKSLLDLTTVIASVGGWPVLEGEKWDDSQFKWNELEKKLIKSGLGQNGFIETYLNVDKNDSNKISLTIYEPFLGLDREDLESLELTNGGFNNTAAENYQRLLRRQAVLMGADYDQVVSDVREIIMFLKDLDRIKFRSTADYNDMQYDVSGYGDYDYQVESNEQQMTIQQIKNIYPEIDWNDLLKTHLNDVDVKLDDDVEIIVDNPEYLIKLRELLATVPARVQANFLFSQSLSKWMDELVEINEDFKDIWREYHEEKKEVGVKPPEWETCVHSTSSTLRLGVSSMFVREYVDVSTKPVMQKIVEEIMEEVKKMLEESDWMDANTKKKAIEKVDFIEAFIAYPDELLDDTLIDDYYADLILSDKNFILNKIKKSKFNQIQNSKKILSYNGSKLWYEKAYFVPEVQAYYSNSENSIKFPAGILDDFFFGADLPNYLNYGGIGFVIGHEIIHGFDDEGSQFDGHGSVVDWWDLLTKEKYDNKTECIVKQYGSQEEVVDGVTMSVDGALTQGENIADNAGLKAAHRTYQRLYRDGEHLLPGLNYTQSQLLWLSAANVWCQVMTPEEQKEILMYEPHSPPRTRINTLLGNMREFSQDWGCKIGENMNPVDKCDVW